MISTDRTGFFNELAKAVKWKYSEEEELIIFDKLPKKNVSANWVLEKLILEFGKKQPPGKKLVSFVWDNVKKRRSVEKKKEHDGCNNCINGYIKLPNLDAFKQYDYSFNMANLTQFKEYTTDYLCPCTGDRKYLEVLENIKNLVFSDPELYEFCFIAMFGFFQEFINPKRFTDIKDFNPYSIWKVTHEPVHIVTPNHYQYVFTGNKPKKKELKKMPVPEYNKKLY